MIALLVGVVLPIIHKTDRVKNDVIMNMPLVYVGREDKFILAAQHFICQLHADFMGLFRRDLPRRKCLYQVAPLSMAWRRVQENSMSAVSAEHPKEDTRRVSSVFPGLQI